MPFYNRGAAFTAYYGVPSGTPSGYLNGSHWLNSMDCGMYTLGDKQFILRCVHFYKDLNDTFGDAAGQNAEAFDYDLPSVEDQLFPQTLVQLLIGDAPEALIRSAVEAADGLHPIVKGLILQDLDEGLSGAEIAENRAALLDPKFLGFTFGQVCEFLPKESWQIDTGMVWTLEDGTEEPIMQSTIFPCSMETWA